MDKLDELLEKYAEIFGDGFPMFQIAATRTEAETMDIIKRCIEEGKDAYALGLVTDDFDIKY